MKPLMSTALVLIALAAVAGHPPAADGGDRAGPKASPRQEALVQLGRRLFFDPLVSRSGTRSCASCHDPEHGFSDPARISDDDFGRTRRHSQTLIDTHRNPSAHWDGEFDSVERLVLARIGPVSGRRGRLGHGASIEGGLGEPTGDDVIDAGDVPTGGGGGGGGYGGGSGPRRGRGDAPGATSDAPGTPAAPSTPTTPTTPSAPGAAAPAGPAAKAPAAKAPEGKAPEANAPEPKQADGKQADGKRAKDAGKQDGMGMLSARERQKRADALRAQLMALPLAADVLEAGGRYDEAFQSAFGNARVNDQRIARAIQAYCDSLHATTAPIDRYLAGEKDALSPAAKRGLALFRGRAGCVTCHTMDGKRPAFTDYAFHNTGMVWHHLPRETRATLAEHDETFRRRRDGLEQQLGPDEGRARISTKRGDLRAFKTPTLRDVARRGPFMHDGRLRTLTDVIRYYADGASGDPACSPHVKPFACTPRDEQDLVAFLTALTGETRVGLPAEGWRGRAPKTRLQFVDADGKPLPHLDVRLRAVGDLAYVGADVHPEPKPLATDEKGWVEFAQRRTTHAQLVLPEGLVPRGGAFVPDSCREARITVPVRGHVRINVRLHVVTDAPETIVAEHVDASVLPGHAVPRTLFTRGVTIGGGPGATSRLVTYRARRRTDVPTRVRLRVPGRHGASVEIDLADADGRTFDLSR